MALRSHYAVVGQPIAHSLSPRLFGWLFQRLGIEAGYVALERGPGREAEIVRSVREGALHGVSVTLPLKEAVLAAADDADALAQQIGAANCLARDAGTGRVVAYNTDAMGIERALGHFGVSLRNARVLMFGAGGAARAAAFVARRAPCKELWIANRTVKRAQQLFSEEQGAGGAIGLDATELVDVLEGADVVLNATQVGLGDPTACVLFAGAKPPKKACVMDMVYRPVQTRLLALSAQAGARTVDGLWMLVYQALEQLRLWRGIEVGAEVAVALHAHLVEEAAK